MQNKWWTNLAVRTQQYADAGDFKGFYEVLKAVYGPTHQARSPLRSVNGPALLKDKTSILSRWSEYFQELFSDDRVVQDSALLRIPQLPVKVELDKLPSMQELIKAIEQMKSGKAAGVEGIPPEFWKSGGSALHSKLHKLLIRCWEQGKVPRDLRNAVIVTFYKNKGKKSYCSNYRGITLFSIAGKIFARVLLNRLVPIIAEDRLPKTQCGFRENWGTTDMVFALRQLQEKCREQNKGLYVILLI